MNQRLKTAILCVLFFAGGLTVQAKDWRGVTPIVSTREDVVRMLGEPERRLVGAHYGPTDEDEYHLREGKLYFNYAAKRGRRGESLPSSIRPGVLIFVRFTPVRPLTWSEAQLNQREFHRYGPDKKNENWNEGYINDNDDLVVGVFIGKIETIVYLPQKVDRDHAADYYRGPESFIPVFDHRPSAGVSADSFCDDETDPGSCDKARLDNLALQLQDAVDSQGYIVTYAARSGGNYKELTDRLVDYLVKHRKIDRGRLIVIDGGYKKEFYFDLVCVPVGGTPPTQTANNNLPQTDSPEK